MIKRPKIERPPLYESFELPTREELLGVKIGDNVKLTFSSRSGNERMWVKVIDCEEGEEWGGTLDNEPLGKMGVKLGDSLRFHPLDVIAILKN